ncbi:sensor histidine kinase [Streptomyces iconiensis]|uniref:histidine kinase n=1 Tax=Streptomyces iconiensis TaxID=1384038 RepID=A0ABT7A7V7_9ACTN|nr:sensor histidine kinase [Streptomyces iconiensis]MDJ1137415.1 histidine kinase [Streptomyces iconiensis]
MRTLGPLLTVLAVCTAPVTAAVQSHGQGAVTAAVAVPLLAGAVWLSPRWPMAATGVPVALGLTAHTELLAPEFWPALAVFGFLAGRRTAAARPALWFFAGVAVAGLPLCVFVARELWAWPTQLLTLLLSVGLPWLLGRYLAQYAELIGTGWRLAEQMESSRRTAADRARLRERARIAGDMHDSLGHDLTLLAVRAGALQVDPALGPRQQEAAGELREAAAAATARLRDIIGVLREDGDEAPKGPVATPDSLAELVRGARDSGLTVTLEGDGAAAPHAREAAPPPEAAPTPEAPHPPEAAPTLEALPVMAARAAYRVVQEALTNAAKHAAGAEVRVRLTREGGEGSEGGVCTVGVTNGPPPGPALPGLASGGTGLVGLDERVRLAGGTLRAQPTPEGGFEVVAEVPVTGSGTAAPRAARAPLTTSARELARARRRVRRSLAQTVLGPLAAVAGILLLMIPVSLVSSSLSVLDKEDYAKLRPGTPRADVKAHLPLVTRDGPPDGAPRTPRGQECVYYSTGLNSADAYRLCFSGGTLAAKSVVGRDG